jgi:hypothetical protein
VEAFASEKYSPIQHLASILWPPWMNWEKAVLVMLTCAFDAGGDETTPFLTVAGFASSTEDWDKFSLAWKKRLDEDGIAYFHAADLDSFHGPFRHWEERSDRKILARQLCADLMDILKSHVYRKFAHTIINKEFMNLTPELREEFALTAYSVAGRTCDKGVRQWIATEPGFRGNPYEIVFEEGDRGKGKLQKRLAEDYKTFPLFKPKKDTQLEDGSIRPGFIPLQAADWLANEVNRMAKQFPNTLESSDQLRWPMQQFIQYPPGFVGTYTAENIKELESGLEIQKKVTEWQIATGLVKHDRLKA